MKRRYLTRTRDLGGVEGYEREKRRREGNVLGCCLHVVPRYVDFGALWSMSAPDRGLCVHMAYKDKVDVCLMFV